jgi:FKBP-type peptidyl-prolyl cis-trans isomerase 2
MKKIIVLLVAIFLIFGCTATDTSNAIDNEVDNMTDENREPNQVNNLDEFRKVQEGDNISVHYTGTLKNGEKFDSSHDRNQTLDFTAGAGQMIKGFDNAVIGMKVGDKKTVELSPSEAYGEKNPEAVVTITPDQFPDFNNLSVGTQLTAGNGAMGVVIEKNNENAIVDFNHRLAGETLVFEIELVSINE